MWLLENLDDVFEGRRLWLQPGKLYLFGRTSSEPGQLAIQDKSISRKHLTIQVEGVKEGEGRNRHIRSSVTIEDLNTKIGTFVDDTQIRGTKHVISGDSSEIKMGRCLKVFRIFWLPVTLTFSFTGRELRDDPWAGLRDRLEQLDINYIAEYDIASTTHVVAKKRNTSKGLQALINGKYIVIESFIDAVLEAAKIPEGNNTTQPSLLEQDFDLNWPDPLQHLPPRGEEPTDRPANEYAPDDRRKEVFDGYTFVFYEKKQYENLFPAITNGKGKALFREAIPHKTQVDDFVRYVKGVAGEKGLGEFEDGSEGKGVVVVRYVPTKGNDVEWFRAFMESVALRLDHRPIDQREFLDAILAVEPGKLRRPLETEPGTQPHPRSSQSRSIEQPNEMEIDEPRPTAEVVEVEPEPQPPPPRRGRPRRAVVSRFKGFASDEYSDDGGAPPPSAPLPASQDGMFVSQSQGQGALQDSNASRTSQRKRVASAMLDEGDVLEDLAPTAAAVKRRRIAAGESPVPRPPPEEPAEEEAEPDSPQAKSSKPQRGKKKQENDIIALARQRREEAEKRAAAERERLDEVPEGGIDFEEIRKLTLVEGMDIRQPPENRTREQDIADGRWDPMWNGRQNFKRFRKQGEAAGRPLQRVMVGLEPVKPRPFPGSDDFWLEESSQRKKKPTGTQSQTQEPSSRSKPSLKSKGKATARVPPTRQVVNADSEDEDTDVMIVDAEPDPEPDLPRTRAGKTAQKIAGRRSQVISQTQSQTATQTRSGKRAAAAPPAKEKPAKRTKRGAAAADSDDELQFKFGRR